MKIWIASFIPKDIPDYTRQVPNGGDKTMIPGPTRLNDCFLTDQRSFSNDPAASARTHLLVEIDMTSMTLARTMSRCGATTEVDCEDGKVECNEKADASGLFVDNFARSADSCKFRFTGGASNPCFAGSPEINWDIKVFVKRMSSTAATVTIEAGSVVEKFPAFEMYASWRNTVKKIFQVSPDRGSTPADLIGAPGKPVSGSASFS